MENMLLINKAEKPIETSSVSGRFIVIGFLQVRENWKKSGNLSGQGKVRGKYYFEKVRENGKFVPPDVRF